MISINEFSNIVISIILIVCIVVSFSNPRALVEKKIVEKANDEQLAEYTKLVSNATIIFIAVFGTILLINYISSTIVNIAICGLDIGLIISLVKKYIIPLKALHKQILD